MAPLCNVDRLSSILSGMRDGGLAGAEAKNEILPLRGLEIHSRAIVGSAKVGLVVDPCREVYSLPGILPLLDSLLQEVNALQASLNDWLEGGHRESNWIVDIRGSSKAYSRSSLDFRDIYVAVILFLGAYVWIKFREVAPRGVHERKRVDKHGRITKVVYEPRFKPPRENGTVFQWIYLGQYATPEEASILYQIAAFYYNRDVGLLNGWFQVPRMSEEERSFTGLRLRAWVIGQAKKVYEDFKKKEAALLLEEYLEDEVMPEQDEVNVDSFIASLLNSDEHQQPALVSQVENLRMDMGMPDDQGLECPSHSFDGMHEGLVLPNGHSLGFEESPALPVSQLPPNTEGGMSLIGSDQLQTLPFEASLLNSTVHQLPLLVSRAENSGMPMAMLPMLDNQGLDCASQSFGGMHEGFVTSNGPSLGFQEGSAIPIPELTPVTQSGVGINNSNQLNLHQIVHNLQELITYQKQQLQESGAQNSVLQNEKLILQQELKESRIRISQLESQLFDQQQLQVISEGVPSFEVEMEQIIPQQNHPAGLMARPSGEAEAQEAAFI